jgi:hypothetical protein
MLISWKFRPIASVLVPLALVSLPSGAAAQAQTATAEGTQTAAPAPQPLTDDQMEVIVARIALYPDELVALITSSSLYPLQIVEASRYLENRAKNSSLQPKATWDGSIVSLLNYPDIVKMMSDDLDWTQSLADALSYQQKDVLIAIQSLRDKAVANGVIKSDDKVKVVQQNENIIIEPTQSDQIYVPQYAPEMLYEPDYVQAPISYYPESYPNYYYPTATFFAGAVTGAAWGALVDWDDWDVDGGDWGGDIDIDCNKCFNDSNFSGKINMNDVDWSKVDRSKINVDRNQFNNLDRNAIQSSLRANDVNSIRNKSAGVANRQTALADTSRSIANKPRDVRANAVQGANRTGSVNRADAKAQGQRANAKPKASAGKAQVKANRPAGKPKAGAKADNRPKNPSAFGQVGNGKRTQVSSQRGHQSSVSRSNRGGGGGAARSGGGRSGGGGGRGR